MSVRSGGRTSARVAPDDAPRRASVVDDARKSIKDQMVKSGWQNSATAVRIRKFLRGRTFGGIMLVALFAALFLPDIFIMAASNTNTILDAILMVVFGLFLTEFLGLTLTDPSYIFSFFFWMDLLGTLSMLFDISIFFGTDCSEPVTASGSDAKKNLMLLRAARAAKLGARAGRLARIVKILRFMPFVNQSNLEQSDVQMARVISNRLSNLLATRVACLTILLVVCMPMFGLVTFPEDDFSLQTWVDRLSALDDLERSSLKDNAFQANHARKRFELELKNFANFFEPLAYGPWLVCRGEEYVDEDGNNVFRCMDPVTSFDGYTSFKKPDRGGSQLIVYKGNVMASYNMFNNHQLESGLGILLIMLVIIIMCGAGLALTASVSDLALRPIERMLTSVKEIAKTVFKHTAQLEASNKEDEEDEDYAEDDENMEDESEMKLLEKIVHKLAMMSELSQKKAHDMITDDMGEEEKGMINMMHDGQGGGERKSAVGEGGLAVTAKKSDGCSASTTVSVEALGISESNFNSWSFDLLKIEAPQQKSVLGWMIMNHPGSRSLARDLVPDQLLTSFVEEVASGYLNCPYHNFTHAVDVAHSTHRFLVVKHSDHFLSASEQWGLVIAGAAHDIGHPGLNNPFLIETAHELALRYNDKSPLENMHCTKLFQICSCSEKNIFQNCTKDLAKELRKNIIEAILHTDMVHHFVMVKELAILYQMHSDVFEAEPNPLLPPSPEECDVFRSGDNKKLVMNLMLHSSDVSNPLKCWEICSKWAELVLDEFFAQGDQEKSLRIPVGMLNDRDKVNKCMSQIGFIEFLVAPLVAAQVRLFPQVFAIGDNVANNMRNWEQTWLVENQSTDEEKEKLKARVEKMYKTMDNAKTRAA